MAEKGEGTRARILDAALGLASRDGLEGLSIGSLATALGLSKSGLFAHFGSKEALQIAVLEHAAMQVGERSARAGAPPPGPERLRFMLEIIMDWIDDPDRPGGCPITGACFEFDDRDGPVRQALIRLQRHSQARALEAIQGFADRSWDPGQLAFEFRAITLGYHHAARVLREERARAWARAALESLIEKASAPA